MLLAKFWALRRPVIREASYGSDRRSQRHAEWAAWPARSLYRQRWRHVATDHGGARTARLQSGEKLHEPAGRGALGDILKSGLGGLLAGGAAGSVLSGGLNDLLKQFQQSGQGDVAKTWVGNGPNKAISSDDLAKALGGDQINTLMTHTG